MTLRDDVQYRANNRCEYCHLPTAAGTATFHVDHVIARYHGGATTLNNLAWACTDCNAYKGVNLSGIDPATGRVTTLYNPRTQIWADHFRMVGGTIEGLTAEGRTTAATLRFNDEERVEYRQILIELGQWQGDA